MFMQSPCLWCSLGKCPLTVRVNQNVCGRTRPVWWSGICKGVFMEFCSSVCLFEQICTLIAEHCWCRKPQVGTHNQYLCLILFGVIYKILTTFITCSDNISFKSAWQNWNKLEEKMCKCAAVYLTQLLLHHVVYRLPSNKSRFPRRLHKPI